MMQSFDQDLTEMSYEQSKNYLRCSTDIYEINHYLSKGDIKSYMNTSAL